MPVKACLLAALLLCPAASRAGTALLWLPAAETEISPALDALEKNADLKLTLALESQPAGDGPARLEKLLAGGRAELALAAQGAPPFFLLYYPDDASSLWSGKPERQNNNPAFFAMRLLNARENPPLLARYPPRGLASSPGGMAAGAAPALRAAGLSWVAGGIPASTSAPRVAIKDGVTAAAFSLLTSTAHPGCADPCLLVVDGALDAAAGRDSAALLTYWLNAAAPSVTVTEALAAAPAGAAEALSLPPWSGDYSSWAASPAQAGALAALAAMRDTITLYMNERPGDKAVKAAMQAYFATGSAAELSGLGNADPAKRAEAELSFQNRAADVYRLIGKELPRWIFAPLENISATERSAPFTSRLGEGWLELENGVPAPPAGTGPAAAAGSPSLRSLRVSWDHDNITFEFLAGELPAAGADFELYMDVNKRPRAGRTKLLQAALPRVYYEDAWEYALSVSNGQASLFTAGGAAGKPAAVLKAGTNGGKTVVKAPRALLTGNPERWGYAALLFLAHDGQGRRLADAICAGNEEGYIHSARHSGK